MTDHLSLIDINAYLDITLKVNKVADGAGYAADVAIAMINGAASYLIYE